MPDHEIIYLKNFFIIFLIEIIEVFYLNFLLNCLKGIFIGSGAILPGISSGVLCIIFGIYEKLLDSILNFFKDIKKNTKFLLPIIIGISIGVLIFSNFLNYFLINFPMQTKSIFIGLILGSIPSLLKQSIKNNQFRPSLLFFLLLSFLIGIFLVVLENYIPNINTTSFSFLYLFLSGFLMSIGVIVPGVSNTIILMLMGVYTIYLNSLSNLYFPVLFPMGLGLILGSFIFMKLTDFLLKNFHEETFFSIIGFSLGSIFVLMPNISFDLNSLISLLCILLGFIIFSLFNKKDL